MSNLTIEARASKIWFELHGESVDYGTEENSLKAISLLNYLHWILSQATKQRPIREE